MAEGKLGVFLALAMLFAGMLAFGCIQSKSAGSCVQYADISQKEQCISYMAIWYQDSYACYDITDITLRESCLDKSIDPKEAVKLKSATTQKTSNATTSTQNPGNQTKVIQEIDNAQVSKCVSEKNLAVEECMKDVAIETKDMTMCAKITADEYKMPCITNVAVLLKNPEICNVLEDSQERGLCNYYSGS